MIAPGRSQRLVGSVRRFPITSATDLVVPAVLAGWVLLTASNQHPSRSFDRFRKYDKTGAAIPNWRFFAPEPAVHDFRILHRVLGTDGSESPWTMTNPISERTWGQAVWFPDRRQQKAISDACSELISGLRAASDRVTESVPYRLLRDHVNELVTAAPQHRSSPQGFQFIIVSDSGYDDAEEPQYLFASKFEECTP
jgi:hypothetical protein